MNLIMITQIILLGSIAMRLFKQLHSLIKKSLQEHFGSVARGESTQNSDIDILVNFLPKASLFDQVRMINNLVSYFIVKLMLSVNEQ